MVSKILYWLQARGIDERPDLPHYKAPSDSAVLFVRGRRQNMDKGIYGPNKENQFC